MNETQKMIPLPDGKRAGIKLSDATWQAIELLAEKRGQTWREWCAAAIEATPDSGNLTAAVRDAAMSELLAATVFGGRVDDLAAMEANVFTRNHGVLDDEGIAPCQTMARGESDFGGFAILFGADDEGRDFLAVRNGLRGGAHFVTVIEKDVA